MDTRDAYTLLSIINLFRAALRGPAALMRFLFRRTAHKHLARAMRQAGL